jgi:hypothetical protein
MFLLGILIFNGLTARRLYKSLGVKGLRVTASKLETRQLPVLEIQITPASSRLNGETQTVTSDSGTWQLPIATNLTTPASNRFRGWKLNRDFSHRSCKFQKTNHCTVSVTKSKLLTSRSDLLVNTKTSLSEVVGESGFLKYHLHVL